MLAERLLAEETMDDPTLEPVTYHRVLDDLATVNRVTLAARPTLEFLNRAIGEASQFTLLDVGFGQGDMLRRVARWAAKRGKTARLTGIDLNPRSAPIARAATGAALPITYVTGDYADLAGASFDCVVSSLVAHHMSESQLLDFLTFMESEARAGWLVNDLHRHPVSYFGYPVLAAAMRWHPIVRADGRLSIARSFRAPEWQALLARAGISQARIERFFPFRLCVSKLRS